MTVSDTDLQRAAMTVALTSENPLVVDLREKLLVAVMLAHGDQVREEANSQQQNLEVLDSLLLRL